MAARIIAAIALSWIVHRAAVQSITLDEALTFLFWVHPPGPTYLEPHSNNHILNSLLMRVSIWLTGLSHLSVRLPALLGGALYIWASYRLTGRLGTNQFLRISLLVCLVFNPFVMDYMVAARGYGLALGFLALTLDTLAATLESPQPPIRTAILLSCFAAIGLSANFSWAYALACLFAASLIAAWWTTRPPLLRFVAAAALPGLAIILAVCGPVLWNFPRHQLFWGSKSVLETVVEIHRSSFDRINPLLAVLEPIKHYAPWALLCFFLIAIPSLVRKTTNWRRDYAAILAGSLAVTALCHWLQFHLFQIPLPYERTALHFVPVFTVMTGAVVAALLRPAFERILRNAAIAMLALIGLYFVGTLRDTHFKEWSICADIRTAFPVIEAECLRTGTRTVVSDLNYTPSLNFYRILNNSQAMDEFPNFDAPSESATIFVLPSDHQKAFIARHNLVQIYKGSLSDFAVLVK